MSLKQYLHFWKYPRSALQLTATPGPSACREITCSGVLFPFLFCILSNIYQCCFDRLTIGHYFLETLLLPRRAPNQPSTRRKIFLHSSPSSLGKRLACVVHETFQLCLLYSQKVIFSLDVVSPDTRRSPLHPVSKTHASVFAS